MPSLDPTILSKIDDLRTISAGWTEPLDVYEFVRIDWQEGSEYYGVLPVDLVSPTFPLAAAVKPLIIPKSEPGHFFELEGDGTLGDEKISIEIWDADGSFADLAHANGEGIRCEVFFWIPAADLLLATWAGHLRNSDDSDEHIWRGAIANGFRSPNLPLPRRAHWTTCQAVFGGLLNSTAELEGNDCPYDKHLGGSVGTNDPGTSAPWTFCPRRTTEDCTERGVHPLYHLSHRTIKVTVLNGQTSGPQLYSVSRGNESNLKDPVRVVMGRRRIRDCQTLAYRRDYNNNTPDRGFFVAIFELCEGPIQSVSSAVVMGQPVQASRYAYSLGARGQAPIDVSLTTHGYSGVAQIRYYYGWVNPGTVDPNNARAEAVIEGLADIREYSDTETYTTGCSRNRVWQLARMLADKRWGYGMSYDRLGLESWIETAEWAAEWAQFTDPDGTVFSYPRSRSDVELVSRTSQQQIEDMCLAGRLSRPYFFQGKLHIQPLRALDAGELAACPVFTDDLTVTGARRIVWEEADGTERSTLRRSQKSDLDIPNRVEGTYHDSGANWVEVPAPPAEDLDQQLKAGRVLGDTSRRTVTKKYSYLGVTNEGTAAALSWWILWFGEFCEGGIRNNLYITFRIWYLDALDLHPFKVIRLQSAQLTRYGFEYFMVTDIKRSGDLHYTITAQAWDNDAIDSFETVIPDPGEGGGGGGGGDIPCTLQFGTVTFDGTQLNIPIDPC